MSKEQMKIAVKDGQLSITIGVDLLCFAVETGMEYGLGPEFKIVNKNAFIQELVAELKAEAEDGTNLIHKAFDRAALNAVENGATGVETSIS